MNTSLSVVFTIDDRFVQHFTVTLVSLLENNKDISLDIYVLHDIEDAATLNNTASFFRDNYQIELKLIKVDNSIFNNYRISLHYSKAVYFRLLITEILPQSVEKALFLDADVVVAGSLRELALHQFKDDEYLLAVDDVEVTTHVARLNAMGFPVTRYFNAGVLLINVSAWRINGLSAKFIDIANEYMERLAWWDQDILNMYFYKDWQPMSDTYNALHLRRKLPVTPAVIHYAGLAKPWLYVHDHPYKSLYWDYIKLTPFKHYQYPDRNLKEIMRKVYIKILDVLKLREPAMFKE
ncbi:glycosyltransferase family 8 protein [Mucilaginibacter sp. HD30]